MLAFGLPILLGHIFQQFYNVIDTTLAGRCLGDDALAAMGATNSIFELVFCLAGGLNIGFSIIVSRIFGENDEAKLKRSIAMMLVLDVSFSVLITIGSLLGLDWVLAALETPPEIIGESKAYIGTILAGLTTTIMYNMEANILRAVGNSRTPLYFLLISSVANVALDLVAVLALGMGVQGLALATVAAQLISVVLCFIHIRRNYSILRLSRKDFVLDKKMLTEMLAIGLANGITETVLNTGTLVMQGAINSFGKLTIAAHLASRKLLFLLIMPIDAMTNALSVFVSQNFGAKRMDRVKEGIKKVLYVCFAWSTVAAAMALIFPEVMVGLLTGSQSSVVIDTASLYLRINIPFFFSLTVLLVLRCALQSLGRKGAPMASGIVELLAKLAATWLIIPAMGYLGVCIIEPIVWTLCMLGLTIYAVRTLPRINVEEIRV